MHKHTIIAVTVTVITVSVLLITIVLQCELNKSTEVHMMLL